MFGLIFGPNDTYFFDDGKGNRKWRAWPAFDQYMASRQIGEITNIAFGEGETFFINHAEGILQHRNYMEDPKDKYKALESWIFHENLPHNRSSVCVNMGVNGSFFAASNQGHRWQKIPEALSDYYQTFTRVDLFMKKRVNTVDLGFNGTFLGIGVDNTWFWEFGDEYKELSKLIGQRGVNDMTWMSINPFAPQEHFVAYSNGTMHWSLPAHWIQDMQSLLRQYATQRGAYIPQSPPPSTPSPLSPTYAQDVYANFIQQMGANLPTNYTRPPSAYSSQAEANMMAAYNDIMAGLGAYSGRPTPTYAATPNLPPRPSPAPAQGQQVPPPKDKWWRRTSSSSSQQQQQPNSPPPAYSPSAAPAPPQFVNAPTGGAIDWNQYMQTTQSALDAYNNAVGAAGGVGGGGYSSTIDTVNSGLQLANSLTDTGNMIGQLAVTGTGAAAACVVM